MYIIDNIIIFNMAFTIGIRLSFNYNFKSYKIFNSECNIIIYVQCIHIYI